MSSGETLEPEDWLRLAYLYRNRPDLFIRSGRIKEMFFGELMQDIGSYFEADERMAMEALTVIGEDSIPYIQEYTQVQTMRYFNCAEVLGHVNSPRSWPALRQMAMGDHHPLVLTTMVRSIIDSVKNGGVSAEDLSSGAKELTSRLVEMLKDPDEIYLVREEAIAFLRASKMPLSRRDRVALDDSKEDISQLLVRPVCLTRKDLTLAFSTEFRHVLSESNGVPPGCPIVVPGINHILYHGIFSEDRVERIAMGVLLAPWQLAGQVSEVLGKLLVTTVESKDYGLQRSLVRLITKIGHTSAWKYLSKFTSDLAADENTRYVAAWSLGGGVDPSDSSTLRTMYSKTSRPETRRVIITVAARRGFADVLQIACRDKDTSLAVEAGKELARLEH